MKFARLRVAFHEEPLSPVHEALVESDGVERARLRFGGVATDPRTYVFSVAGADAAFADALAARSAVVEAELVHDAGDRALAYVRADPSDVELAVHGTLTRDSLVTALPVDFHADGSVVFRVLGDPDDLQTAVAELGEMLPVSVERVGDYDAPPERAGAALTDRQEQVVRTALELGHYDTPRGATHEDVAGELDCAPSTASEHLRKAEAALVRAAFASLE
jgi:hypothetical protein